MNCRSLTGEWKPLTPPRVTLSGHRSRQGWWIKRERMKLLIFFFFWEIRQIRLSYLIHSGMMDEDVDFSVLCVDRRWDFGRFCCERAKGYQEWFLWKLTSSKVPVFRKAVTEHSRRRNFTGQYLQCRGYTLQWNQPGVRRRGDNSEPEEATGLQEAGTDERGNAA